MSRRVRKGTLNVPGMPCPECETRIVIDPRVLLSAAPIACPGCGLRFEVDTEESAEALSALQRYMDRFEELEERISDVLEETAGGRRRLRGRPPRRMRGPRRKPRS